MKTVSMKSIVIGEGMPKICVPIVAATLQELSSLSSDCYAIADLIEWRMDHYSQIEQPKVLLAALQALRIAFPKLPLLATFRTKQEGGQRALSLEEYCDLNKTAIASGMIDAIDLEFISTGTALPELITYAHEHQVKVLLSNHNFTSTPVSEELVARLCAMQEADGDIVKIAVMPNSMLDVLELLKATVLMKERYAACPVVTMSMGSKGLLSRISGELCGSAITFGTVDQASAPGQIPAEDLQQLLRLLHQTLK